MELASALKRFQSEGWRQFGLVASKLTEDETHELQDSMRRTDRLIELIESTNSSDLKLLDKLRKQAKLQQYIWFRVGAPHIEHQCDACENQKAAAERAPLAHKCDAPMGCNSDRCSK